MSLSHEAALALMNTKAEIVFDEPMSRHTSFQIGGNADALASPSDIDGIRQVIAVCRQYSLPFHIIGNGTNLLVSDDGVRGVVIQLRANMSSIDVDGQIIRAGAGALLSGVAATALRNSLSGFELLGGIPGSVGGAVYMNAGAYGAQIGDVLVSSTYIDACGNIGTYKRDEHNFGYRKSVYTNSDKIIIGAEFQLSHADANAIKQKMSEYTKKRRDKQPLAFPSAGSVFKRPEGYFAGALIEQAGLKGYTIGGAQVSQLHAGFIINIGGATANDVMRLIWHIKETVLAQRGVMLECEIKTLGEIKDEK